MNDERIGATARPLRLLVWAAGAGERAQALAALISDVQAPSPQAEPGVEGRPVGAQSVARSDLTLSGRSIDIRELSAESGSAEEAAALADADAVALVVDASEGLQAAERRIALVAALLGVRRMLCVVRGPTVAGSGDVSVVAVTDAFESYVDRLGLKVVICSVELPEATDVRGAAVPTGSSVRDALAKLLRDGDTIQTAQPAARDAHSAPQLRH